MKSDFLKPINSLLYWNQASSFVLPYAAVLGGKIPSSQSQYCISGVLQDITCRYVLFGVQCEVVPTGDAGDSENVLICVSFSEVSTYNTHTKTSELWFLSKNFTGFIYFVMQAKLCFLNACSLQRMSCLMLEGIGGSFPPLEISGWVFKVNNLSLQQSCYMTLINSSGSSWNVFSAWAQLANG